ncbi:type II toxin-antitoxin system HipA family toxin [Thalassospira xianhensis]|uniref:type II toxin-antitoxin system HipA family toxin n=1 Tax=Thalassospira xianhensis TaxID=478503 RepID=UPI000DED8476|nr:HipA domain-containing protein [Thalassospira xianhensis]
MSTISREIDVFLGEGANPIGILRFATNGRREHSSFVYSDFWLEHKASFAIDPALQLVQGPQFHTGGKGEWSSVFHGVISDTEPDGWGKRVMMRRHARQQRVQTNANAEPLNTLDFLLGVDDAARMGALRFRDENGNFCSTRAEEAGTAPPRVHLDQLIHSSQAIERDEETERDIQYLEGNGTTLGGMRPKSSIQDDEWGLCIGKFPSAGDTKPVTKAEILALKLAAMAGMDVAEGKVVRTEAGNDVAVIRRFDRDDAGRRKLYASAKTMLQVEDDDEHTYTELADVIKQYSPRASEDLSEMWKRMVFNILINNVDDHLRNHAFLYDGQRKWILSPGFDINPFPDKARELKLWVSEDHGPEALVQSAMDIAPLFGLRNRDAATAALAPIVKSLQKWREVGRSQDVGMTNAELGQYENAFEHAELEFAAGLV